MERLKRLGVKVWLRYVDDTLVVVKSVYLFFNIHIKAPAIDFVGVDLENGKIILNNLKFDTSIMSFMQEWGPIKSLTFRTGNSIKKIYLIYIIPYTISFL